MLGKRKRPEDDNECRRLNSPSPLAPPTSAVRILDIEPRRKQLPEELQALVETISERRGDVPPSLRAQRFLAKQAAGEKRKEDDSIHGIARLLYLHP
jgi:hypothetical protein